MKKIVSIVLTLALVLGMALTCAQAESTVELEFLCLKEEVQDVLQEICDDYCAAHPGVKITINCPADGSTVLRTRSASNDFPDITMVYPAENTYKAYYDAGQIKDLTGMDFISNVEPAMLELSEYNGKQWSLPYTLSTYGIYYNKKIFNELGIEPPTTLEELKAICPKIKEAGYDAFTLPLQDGQNQIIERNMGALDPDTYLKFQKVAAGEMDIKDVPAISAFADMMLAIKPYSTADALGLNGDGATSDFANEKAAMRFNGSWFLSSVQIANPDIDTAMIGIPAADGTVKIPVNIDSAFAISSSLTPEQEEAAIGLLAYLATPEVAQKYYEVDGNINMIKGVSYDKEPLMDAYEKVMAGDMSITQINLWGDNATSVRSDLGAAFQALMMNEDMDEYYELCEDAVTANMQ